MGERLERSVLCLFPELTSEGLEDFRQRHIDHPAKSVPLHITLLYEFFPPGQLGESVIEKLERAARNTPQFEFRAIPMSAFPLSKVLYLTPSPMTPIEKLASSLHDEFPEFRPPGGHPVYHMTIAMGYPMERQAEIVDEYFRTFGQGPLPLRAHRMAVCAQHGDEWNRCLSIELGGQ